MAVLVPVDVSRRPPKPGTEPRQLRTRLMNDILGLDGTSETGIGEVCFAEEATGLCVTAHTLS